jgi:hypothetical protein
MTTEARAKIYCPAKTAMQSGRSKTRQWVLEYEPTAAMTPDALMGWNSAGDTLSQIQLKFPTKEAAIAYAMARQIPYDVAEPRTIRSGPKSYAANFSFTRKRAYADNV